MKDFNNNVDILQVLLKWKYHIIIITAIGIILAVIISSPYFITPKYKSTAIAYPANISPYSDESETEQMLQLLQSKDIRDSVIEKFNLPEHYEINREYKYFLTILYYEYSKNVSISKTPYESVEISVLDKDPQMASDMVNAIIDFFNKKVRRLHNEKYVEVINMYEDILAKKRNSIDSLKSRLRDISREYGIYDFDNQPLEITRGYLKTIEGANKGNINQDAVEKMKEGMEEKGGELVMLVESIRNEARTYADFKVEYEDALRFYTDHLTYANVITKPFPADKKSYPIRWLIVLFTALATFFVTIIVIMIIDRYRTQLKNQFNSTSKK